LEALTKVDLQKIKERLFEVLPTLSNFDLRFEMPVIESLIASKRYADLKTYLGLLISKGIATQEDLNKFKLVLLEQNINMDDI
jgi:hypothetical protein